MFPAVLAQGLGLIVAVSTHSKPLTIAAFILGGAAGFALGRRLFPDSR